MSGTFDPQIFQAAILEVAEATKAAVRLAQSVQQAPPPPSSSPAGSPSSGPSANIDWSKLLNKPPLFEYKTTEDEIRAYRDWSWRLVQFLNTIDPGYEKELQALMDDPGNSLDLSTASQETRHRSTKLYGLLASLCRNRSLNVVRSVKSSDGLRSSQAVDVGPQTCEQQQRFGIDVSFDKLANLPDESASSSSGLKT